MLDMIPPDATEIGSKYLEPACGNGNFLEEIIQRKLEAVLEKFGNRIPNVTVEIASEVVDSYPQVDSQPPASTSASTTPASSISPMEPMA